MTDETEELTLEERDDLAVSLRALSSELEEAVLLARETAKPVALDQAAVGRVSRVDAIQQQHLALATLRATEIRLAQVKRALTAFAAGEYGDCVECDEPIGRGRLQSRPETSLCLRCQAERESR